MRFVGVVVAAWAFAGCTSDDTKDGDSGAPLGETTPDGCPAVYTVSTAHLASCTATRSVDDGADGTVDSTVTEARDEAGRLTEVDYSDGFTFTFGYDDAGNEVYVTFDDDGDGTVDSTIHWSYDAEGRLTEIFDDHPAYGYRTTFSQFSACGPVFGVTDDGDDGTVDGTITYRYAPTLVTYSSDDDDDGVIDYLSNTTYDAADGRALHREAETDATSSGPEYTTDYTYAPNGWFDVVVDVSPYSGTTTTTSTYDADDRLASQQIDNSQDGPSLETLTWDCPASP